MIYLYFKKVFIMTFSWQKQMKLLMVTIHKIQILTASKRFHNFVRLRSAWIVRQPLSMFVVRIWSVLWVNCILPGIDNSLDIIYRIYNCIKYSIPHHASGTQFNSSILSYQIQGIRIPFSNDLIKSFKV